MKVITQGAQFGRIVQVELRNYITKQKFFIDNNLRIDFTFFKTIDETTEASVGQVKIYGLTQETFNEMYSIAGELELRFGYSGTEVQTLFIATITTMYPENTQEGVCAVINVSANYAEYMYTKIKITPTKEQTMVKVLFEFAKAFNLDRVEFRVDAETDEQQNAVSEMIATRKIYFACHDYAKAVLKEFAEKYHLRVSMELKFDKDGRSIGHLSHLSVSIKPEAMPTYINNASLPYRKIGNIVQELSNDNVTLLKGLEQDQSDDNAFILNSSTGLLGYPKQEYKLISVPADWKPAASEEVTRKGQETIMTNAQKKKEADEKYAKKVAKATEKGTLDKLKPQKQTRQGNIQVKRKYLRVTALLNAAVKPQSQVNIQSNLDVYSGIYRVRTATYQGTNGNGTCSMELYCEDSLRRSDAVATEKDVRELGDMQVEGGVGEQTDGDGVVSGTTEE